MTFDGSAIEGFSRVQESDMLAMPDPNTFEILPWRGEDAPVARMFCDIQHLSGEPFEGDPRYVLQRNLERAREKGFTFYAAPEMEFFYFKSPGRRRSRSTTPATSTSPQMDMASNLRKQTILTLEAMGIPVEYSYHELGPSQHEIDLRYTDALTMADNVMTFRLVVKEVATDLGVYATFMPKPIAARSARGCTRTSRCSRATSTRSTTPATSTASRRSASAFIAGLLRHAREITAVTQPVGQLLQAPHRRLRGARLRLLGAQQPLRARARAAAEAGQGELDPHRVPLTRSRVQPVPRVLA